MSDAMTIPAKRTRSRRMGFPSVNYREYSESAAIQDEYMGIKKYTIIGQGAGSREMISYICFNSSVLSENEIRSKCESRFSDRSIGIKDDTI
jgi:hypothetical protein